MNLMSNLKKYAAVSACGLMLSATLAAGAQIVVRLGPPPPHHEVIPVSPHEGWVWQPGYNRWDGHAYVWVPGNYVAPPYNNARWIPGHWAHRPGGYVWIEGHWRR